MNLQRLIVLLVIAVAVFYVLSNPPQAAGVLRTALSDLRSGAEALITFVRGVLA